MKKTITLLLSCALLLLFPASALAGDSHYAFNPDQLKSITHYAEDLADSGAPYSDWYTAARAARDELRNAYATANGQPTYPSQGDPGGVLASRYGSIGPNSHDPVRKDYSSYFSSLSYGPSEQRPERSAYYASNHNIQWQGNKSATTGDTDPKPATKPDPDPDAKPNPNPDPLGTASNPYPITTTTGSPGIPRVYEYLNDNNTVDKGGALPNTGAYYVKDSFDDAVYIVTWTDGNCLVEPPNVNP